jgi:hypothetical protein
MISGTAGTRVIPEGNRSAMSLTALIDNSLCGAIRYPVTGYLYEAYFTERTVSCRDLICT